MHSTEGPLVCTVVMFCLKWASSVDGDACIDREKKKEKDREDLWRRLESLQLNNQQLNNQQLSVQKIAT